MRTVIDLCQEIDLFVTDGCPSLADQTSGRYGRSIRSGEERRARRRSSRRISAKDSAILPSLHRGRYSTEGNFPVQK